MKLVVAGSRYFSNYALLKTTLDSLDYKPTHIISGTCSGADRLGERWARENNIPIIHCPAYWDDFGKKAAFLRNQLMAKLGDRLIAFWDGESRGTKMMIELMEKELKLVKIIRI